MSVLPTTIVLLDPTDPDGETALDLLESIDDHVALVVLTSGPSAQVRETRLPRHMRSTLPATAT